jgi:homogentisate phytyltransferase/homogentisate geranylgeranyltransferase
VTSLAALSFRLLRFRVAAMVWTFMLLGAAWPAGLPTFSPGALLAALALAASYVAATSVNDIADADVDRVNHPRDRARPLVTGEAGERDLWRLHGLACVVALAAAGVLGLGAVLVVAGSLAIGAAYSLPPLRVSYRTWLAPLLLALAYVPVPYLLGAIAVGRALEGSDAWLAAALTALFLARILLKDFRDRPGDARYGKPTLLLRFGGRTTCAASFCSLVVANVLLVVALRPPLALALPLEVLLIAVAVLLLRLARAADPRAEQIAIGLGARLGNGLLLCLLAWLVLGGEGASYQARATFVWGLAAAFLASTTALAAQPERVVIGYKG